jgi:hypothetical protein
MYQGDGIGRHPEPGLLRGLPGTLPGVDVAVCAKASVLLSAPGKPTAALRDAHALRSALGMQAAGDGQCVAVVPDGGIVPT